MKPSMAWIAAGWLIVAPGFVRADDSQKDQEKLKGKWTVAEFVISGKPIPEEDREKVYFVFTDEKMTLQGPGGIGERHYSYKLDPAKDPKELDMGVLDGAFKGDSVPAIYELKGDTLRLCIPNKPGSPRPKEFDSPEQSGIGLFVLKRAKD